MKNRAAIFFLLIFWGIAPLFLYALPADHPDGPEIVAHRGKAWGYPENSLSGFEKVLQYEIDYIEVDVRTTADGVLVVFHDGTLDRTTHSKGVLKELSFRDLQQVGLKKKRYGKVGETVPTLAQVCELLARHNQGKETPVNLYVDCKDADPTMLLQVLKQYNLAEGAVFYGGDGYLKKLKALFPEARIIPGLKDVSDLDAKIAELDPYGFDVKWKILNPVVAAQIHAKGRKIYTDLLFIYDHGINYKKARRRGVDVIQTDRSRKASKVLR